MASISIVSAILHSKFIKSQIVDRPGVLLYSHTKVKGGPRPGGVSVSLCYLSFLSRGKIESLRGGLEPFRAIDVLVVAVVNVAICKRLRLTRKALIK